MRTTLRIHAAVGHAQPFHGSSAHQVLGYNFLRILGLHVAVPHCVRIDDHGGAVLALVKAAGLVNAHFPAQPGFARELLQPGVQAA